MNVREWGLDEYRTNYDVLMERARSLSERLAFASEQAIANLERAQRAEVRVAELESRISVGPWGAT